MEENPKFWVGMLSQKRIRKVRLVNMLTKDEHTIEVCAEDTLEQIKDKYLVYNRYVCVGVCVYVCTDYEHTIEVCAEDTLEQIKDKCLCIIGMYV